MTRAKSARRGAARRSLPHRKLPAEHRSLSLAEPSPHHRASTRQEGFCSLKHFLHAIKHAAKYELYSY